MKKLIVIVGPTAVGKTAAAIAVAKRLNTEIISADSRQVFKELHIGTAKPTTEELASVPHHFVGTKSITEEYDAGQYGHDALTTIVALFKKKNWLVMTGGSGLYVKAVLEGFDDMPEVPDGMREEIVKEYQARGLGWLQHEVAEADPDYFVTVDRQNPHRLMRALELIRSSGQPMNALRVKKKNHLPFEVLKVGLNIPREELYQRIDTRMDAMIQAGLFREAETFVDQKGLNALQTVGYREIYGYLEGQYDYEEAVRLLKRNSRRYAKRQLTWFQRDPEITWFSNSESVLQWLEKSQLVNSYF